MPAVSVIVPVYKAEKYLEKCVDSILSQSFSDFELILVDDGSPDNCPAMCDEWAAKDSRIRVVHKENGGVSSARNTGLDRAAGAYVLFVDSDDYVHPDFIRRLYENKSDLTLCGFECRNREGEALFAVCVAEGSYAHREQIPYAGLYEKNTLYGPCCKLFRADILKTHSIRFPAGISWGEDGMFVADYLAHISSLRALPDVLYYYIRYDDAASLSTRVRPGIIGMVVQSREYCIRKMAQTAPWAQEQVKTVCQEDIRQNCADFVKMLLCSNTMSWKEKEALLAAFLNDPYVAQTARQPQRYYAKHGKVGDAMEQGDAPRIVSCYRRITRKQRWFRWGYQKLYQPLPQWVKRLYRGMKGETE